MAPRPPGPAPAPRASGEMCGSLFLARSAAAPRPLRLRMERAEAGRMVREHVWSRRGSPTCPPPRPARALGARPWPTSTPGSVLCQRQMSWSLPVGPPPRLLHQDCRGRPSGCLWPSRGQSARAFTTSAPICDFNNGGPCV
ncbi:hypothetical protein NDU88_004134 [Pleurodeles waltl]|uniref:Uncharacterized protein n=1 Tax=Pleurodeles waltl TaxID=8319 RepID=A0AAV7NLB2_PLEWA|nr:hypothetical protein NDU88_004134 [Pleurodeles waltl]